MIDGIQFSELVDYLGCENQRWKQFFSRYPQALDLPLDIAGDVRKLVRHIFEVELFFANAASGKPQGNAEKLPTGTLDELFAISETAAKLYREFIATAKPESWSEVVQLNGRTWKASRRKMLAQAFTHSIRHWAQIATYLRQQGFKQEWRHDLLVSDAMK